MHDIFIEILLTLISILTPHVVEGCGRTPNKPQSTASPLENFLTTELPTHRHPCTDDETRIAKCSNGGECYTIPSESQNRSIHCLCPEIYYGKWCEEISPDIFGELQRGGKVVIGGVAAGVCVVILLVVIVIVYYVIKIRKKRHEERIHRRENGIQGETLLEQNILNHNHTKNGFHNKETNV